MSLRTPNEPTDNFRLPAKPAATPQPKPDTWQKTDTPHIERNQDGRLRTNLPLPKPMRTQNSIGAMP